MQDMLREVAEPREWAHKNRGGKVMDFVRNLRSTTLSTLVKEMEGRKRESDWNKIETGDYDAASKMRVADKNILFNAGISAAQEVVEKMGV